MPHHADFGRTSYRDTDFGRTDSRWYALNETESLLSPALLVYPERVIANIERTIALAGAPERLRPHVKTHKSADVVQMHLERGVSRFKCATPAEALMLARAGATDVLIAYQLTSPARKFVAELARRYTGTRFGCLVDNGESLRQLDVACADRGVTLTVYLDLDVGMHRSGISPGEEADRLYREFAEQRNLRPGGIHAYDGHNRHPILTEREAGAARSRGIVLAMRERLIRAGLPVEEVVLGGTPSFPCHAAAWEAGITLSPGTYTYFDWGSATTLPDLPFVGAALVFGRVVSVPAPGRFAIDVGSKAIAADYDQPRGIILNLPAAEAGPQSEEHWVFTISPEVTPRVGTPVYVWPRHICPTVEHYDRAELVDAAGMLCGWWPVSARGRAVE